MRINLVRLLWPESFYLEKVLQQSIDLKYLILIYSGLIVFLSNCINNLNAKIRSRS